MVYLFVLIFFSSIPLLLVGLIRPAIFTRIFKVVPKRKTIALVGSAIIIFSFFGIGLTAPEIEKSDNSKINISADSGLREQNEITQEEITDSSEPEDNGADEITTEQADAVQDQAETQSNNSTEKDTSHFQYYAVTSVVDGDTVKVNIDGKIITLRLIGMDTPETVDPRKPVQCFGQEASNKAKEILSGQKVRIEKDPTQGELDKYGRTLAYIYRTDGLFYNKYMIEQGYAHEYTYAIPYKYQSEFKAAENDARVNQRGLWSPDTCNGDTTQSVDSNNPSGNTETNDTQASQNNSTGKYYTSSHYTAKYYYPEDCSAWQSLSEKYLKSYNSLDDLLAVYPTKTLSPQCQ